MKQITRRKFIADTATLLALSSMSGLLSGCGPTDEESLWLFNGLPHIDENGRNVVFYFENLTLAQHHLIPEKFGRPSYLIVQLPPQSLHEQHYHSAADQAPPGQQAAKLSGHSYLSFELWPGLTDDHKKLKFHIRDLLAWQDQRIFRLITTLDFSADALTFTNTNDVANKAILRPEELQDKPGFARYKAITEKLIKGHFLTILELPAGLILAPIIADRQTRIELIQNTYQVSHQEFNHTRDGRRIQRTVRERWNTELRYRRLDTDKCEWVQLPPALRAIGIIAPQGIQFKPGDPRNPCSVPSLTPSSDLLNYLPTLLDEVELVYLNKLYNQDERYDIKVNSPFLLTALGASLRFSYKNSKFAPGDNTLSLVEYEHHFQDGRDNYIKVSRIGVIAPTGHKALHVKIAERKIIDGVSFLNYKEYVEVIDPVINYPAAGGKLSIPYTTLAGQGPNQVNQINFTKVAAAFTRSPPIYAMATPADPDPNAFWVYKDGTFTKPEDAMAPQNLLLLPFNYYDQNGRQLTETVTHSIYFLRRDRFCNQTAINLLLNDPPGDHAPVKKFDDGRMRIPFNNQTVAFTPDVADDDGENDPKKAQPGRNKLNQLVTEYVDYYFNIAQASGNQEQSIFDTAAHVIYPQISRAKVYIEHLQHYGGQKLVSLVNYHRDYLTATFDETANQAKLFIQHTADFKDGKLLDLCEKTAPWQNELQDGYNQIKAVFNRAGDRIGGLVNPDIQIERFGLVKQALSLPDNVNQQWQTGAGRVLRAVDIFQGKSAEILNGIDLRLILEDVLPAAATPIFDVSKVLTELDKVKQFTQDIGHDPLVQDALQATDQIHRTIQDAQAKISQFRQEVAQQEARISQYKNELSAALPDLTKLRNGAKLYFEQKRLAFIELASTQEQEVQTYIRKEFIREYADVQAQLNDLKFNVKASLNTALTALQKQLNDVNSALSKKLAALQNGPLDTLEAALKQFETDRKSLKDLYNSDLFFQKIGSLGFLSASFKDYFSPSGSFGPAVDPGYSQLLDLVRDRTAAYLQDSSDSAKQALLDAQAQLDKKRSLIETALYPAINVLLTNFQLLSALLPDSEQAGMQALFKRLVLLQKMSVGYYVDRYFQLKKDVTDLSNTLLEGPKNLFFQLQGQVNSFMNETVQGKTREQWLEAYLPLLLDPRSTVAQLRATWQQIQQLDTKLLTQLDQQIGASNYLRQQPAARQLQQQLDLAISTYNDTKGQLEAQLGIYQRALEEQAKGLVLQVKDRFDALLKNQTDPEKIKAAREQFGKVLALLTTPQKQELRYNWSTTHFKSASLGIIRFDPAVSPPTKLQVSVHAVTQFDLLAYPAIVQKVETYAENTLTDFSLTFLSAITIDIAQLRFVSGSQTPTAFHINIRNVRFTGALSFIQLLESLLGDLGEGFGMQLHPDHVTISYNSPVFTIGAPGFTFANISFGIALSVYFDGKPLQVTINLARADSKAVVAASIYGGCFFCAVTLEPKRGIVGIEMALEMGAYMGIRLGPIKGEVKFMVGLYYKKDDSGVIMEGYFIAEGTLSVWILSVSARLYMYVRSQNSYVEGGCTVSYSVKLGFIKKSFSGSFTKRIAGAPNNNTNTSTAPQTEHLLQFLQTPEKVATTVDLSDIFDNDDEATVLSLDEWTAYYHRFYR